MKVILLDSEPSRLSVHDLRKMGLKVTVIHQRKYKPTNEGMRLMPTGGETTIHVASPYVRQQIKVSTTCHPRDHYCKKIGVKMAMSRINPAELNQMLHDHLHALVRSQVAIKKWEDNPIY